MATSSTCVTLEVLAGVASKKLVYIKGAEKIKKGSLWHQSEWFAIDSTTIIAYTNVLAPIRVIHPGADFL